MTKFILFLPVAFFVIGIQAEAVNSSPGLVFDPGKGSVSFLAVGRPSAIKIRGEGPGPSGSLLKNSSGYQGSLEFDLTALHTGINMRDQHMKEKYLDTGTYPKATLRILSFQPSVGEGEAAFSGELMLKGKVHSVAGAAALANSAEGQQVKAHFSLNLADYGIDIPKYAGITVAQDVELSVEASVKEAKQ